MYFVLYDRTLKSIGDTYILEKWSRTQRSMDFDDLKIVGEQIPYSADPFLVVVNDKQGRQMFSGLASTPSIDERSLKTTIFLKDYMTLLNSEIIVDWSAFRGSTVAAYLEFILNTWLNQVEVGFETITWDVHAVDSIQLDSELFPTTGIENVMAYDLVKNMLSYYDLYDESELNIYQKTLKYSFKRCAQNSASLRLSDFGINSIEKSFGDYNRATVYSSSFVKNQEWALTESNKIVKLPTTENVITKIQLGNTIRSDNEFDYVEIKTYSQAIANKKIAYRNEVANIVFETPYYLIKCVKYGELSKQTNVELTGLNTETTLYINDNIIYPAKNRNFIAEKPKEDLTEIQAINAAVYDAVMGLAQNRYQENVDLDAQQYRSIFDLTQVDFSYTIDVFSTNGFYKRLPVGEIETNSDGQYIVRLGYRIQELTQEI